MNPNNRARCEKYGHDWSPWGPFETVRMDRLQSRYSEGDGTLTKAYRYRTCYCCGARQRYGWHTGEIEDVTS